MPWSRKQRVRRGMSPHPGMKLRPEPPSPPVGPAPVQPPVSPATAIMGSLAIIARAAAQDLEAAGIPAQRLRLAEEVYSRAERGES